MLKFLKNLIPTTIELGVIIIILWIFWIVFSGLKPNEFADAINPALTGVTIFLVYKTFQLQNSAFEVQKKELEETKNALEGQGDTMKEEKIQALVIELLGLTQEHLKSLQAKLEIEFPTTKEDRILYYLKSKTKEKIQEDIEKGNLNDAITYFRTLRYIESLLIEDYSENKVRLNNYLGLLDSQITDNIRSLYNAITTLKAGTDLDKITFKYLFTLESFIYKKETVRKPLGIYVPFIPGQ